MVNRMQVSLYKHLPIQHLPECAALAAVPRPAMKHSPTLYAAVKFAINTGADPALMPDPGLEKDSALLPSPPEGAQIVQSVDMLSQIITDPFRLGRIAAMHSLSDLHAANAKPCDGARYC